MKGKLFTRIVNLLSARVPELQKIDLDRGQLDQTNTSGLTFPLALISFGDIEYQDEGQGLQYGKSIVDIYVVQQSADLNTPTGPPQATLVNLLNFPNKVYLALQDANTKRFFNITRVKDISNEVRDDLMIDQVQFMFTINDDSKRRRDERRRSDVSDATSEVN